MERFKNGDLVENVGDGCRAIVVDATLGWINGEWCVSIQDVEGPGIGVRYNSRAEVLRLVA